MLGRGVAAVAVAAMILAGSTAGAADAATLTMTSIPYEVTGDYCSHADVFYTGTGANNNLTTFGVDGVEGPALTWGPVCWKMTGIVYFSDLQTAVQTGPGCSPKNPALRYGSCQSVFFDHAVIDTGGGKDAIRVLPWQVFTTTIYAGDGPDAIKTVNGGHDIISCGPGTDQVQADSLDEVGADCETVQYLIP